MYAYIKTICKTAKTNLNAALIGAVMVVTRTKVNS